MLKQDYRTFCFKPADLVWFPLEQLRLYHEKSTMAGEAITDSCAGDKHGDEGGRGGRVTKVQSVTPPQG